MTIPEIVRTHNIELKATHELKYSWAVQLAVRDQMLPFAINRYEFEVPPTLYDVVAYLIYQSDAGLLTFQEWIKDCVPPAMLRQAPSGALEATYNLARQNTINFCSLLNIPLSYEALSEMRLAAPDPFYKPR